MGIPQGDGADQYGDDMCQECRTRIEEDPDNNREHGIGQDVHIEYIVCHHKRRDDTIEHDQGEE